MSGLDDGSNVPSMEEACTNQPYSGTTCIKASLLSAGASWGGWYFLNGILKDGATAPEPNWGAYSNAGLPLAGASRLRFRARGASGGERVEFFVAGVGYSNGIQVVERPDSSLKVSTGYITLGTSWKEYVINLSGKDLSYVLGGFGWSSDVSSNGGEGIVFYLDDIRYEISRLSEPHFVLSYQTQATTNGFDLVSRNVAYTYDNAVAAIAFLASGDTNRAAGIADAFVYALNHDREYTDGRLRNAYQAGDLAVPPGWVSNGKTNTVRLPGWSDPATGEWREYLDQAGITAGNQAWAMLALLNCYGAMGNADYLEAARTMGEWVERECRSTSGAGGYTAGYGWTGLVLTNLTYKSTEHAIDLYAAFSWLHRLTPDDVVWSNRADHAFQFIAAMYDAENGRFRTGTGEDGVTVNTNVYALDCQVWPLLALGTQGTDYSPALTYAETRMRSGRGFAFSEGHTNGVWMEGTAFAAVTYGAAKDASGQKAVIDFLADNRDASGAFYATDTNSPTLETGIDLSDGSPWLYYHRLHLAPTAWFVLAARGWNPYTGCQERAVTCAVTFDAQGGSADPVSMLVTNGDVYGSLPIPVREGYLFDGWWTAAGGGGIRIAGTTVVEALTDVTLYAKWVQCYTGSVGVVFLADLSDILTNGEQVTVKGVPAGLKYNAASQTIAGVPSKFGSYAVVVTSSGGGAQTVRVDVASLPSWAYGTYNGCATDGTRYGPAAMTVTDKGKITGKFSLAGTNWSFSASSYASGNAGGGFEVSATAKAGRLALPVGLTVAPATNGVAAFLGMTVGTLGDAVTVAAYRNVWSDPGMASVLTPYVGYYTATLAGDGTCGSGYLTLTAGAKGAVKTAGKLADGTSVSQSGTLVLDENGRLWAVTYAAPSAYKGGSLSGLSEFAVPASGAAFLKGLDGAPLLWESLSPTATGEYGEGFGRGVSLTGGMYGALTDLGAYYTNGVSVGPVGLPELTAAVKYTDWNEDGTKKVTQTETESVGAADPSPEGLVLGWKGTGFSVPAADKPEWDGEAYVYGDTNGDGADNACGLTFKLNAKTGLFSGAFTVWYDYVSAEDYTKEEGGEKTAHMGKKVAFQGAVTPVREDSSDGVEGRGYFLWKSAGATDAGKTYAFSASYDFLLLGGE